MSCLSQRDSKRRAEQRRRGVRQVPLAGVLASLYDSIHWFVSLTCEETNTLTQRNAEAQEPRLASPARTHEGNETMSRLLVSQQTHAPYLQLSCVILYVMPKCVHVCARACVVACACV